MFIYINMIKNRGTGAGGSNTNKNGLSYEKKTLLNSQFDCVRKENGFDYPNYTFSS